MTSKERHEVLKRQLTTVYAEIEKSPDRKKDILIRWLDMAPASGIDPHLSLLFYNIANARNMEDNRQVVINTQQLGNINFGEQHSVVNTLTAVAGSDQQKQVAAVLANLLTGIEKDEFLAASQKQEAAEVVASLAEEAKSGKPKQGVVKALLTQLPTILKSAEGLLHLYESSAPVLQDFFLHHHF